MKTHRKKQGNPIGKNHRKNTYEKTYERYIRKKY